MLFICIIDTVNTITVESKELERNVCYFIAKIAYVYNYSFNINLTKYAQYKCDISYL